MQHLTICESASLIQGPCDGSCRWLLYKCGILGWYCGRTCTLTNRPAWKPLSSSIMSRSCAQQSLCEVNVWWECACTLNASVFCLWGRYRHNDLPAAEWDWPDRSPRRSRPASLAPEWASAWGNERWRVISVCERRSHHQHTHPGTSITHTWTRRSITHRCYFCLPWKTAEGKALWVLSVCFHPHWIWMWVW